MRSMADTTGLKEIRERFQESQEGLARRTKTVRMGTVRNAENGNRVTYDTAMQLLEAINALLAERNESPVTLDDLRLSLY